MSKTREYRHPESVIELVKVPGGVDVAIHREGQESVVAEMSPMDAEMWCASLMWRLGLRCIRAKRDKDGPGVSYHFEYARPHPFAHVDARLSDDASPDATEQAR